MANFTNISTDKSGLSNFSLLKVLTCFVASSFVFRECAFRRRITHFALDIFIAFEAFGQVRTNVSCPSYFYYGLFGCFY